jgi:hypothetical protein
MSLQFVQETFNNFHIDPKRTLASVANNHAGDKKEEGITQTVNNLTSIGCTVFGTAKIGNVRLVRNFL